jgi:hypothetical protein
MWSTLSTSSGVFSRPLECCPRREKRMSLTGRFGDCLSRARSRLLRFRTMQREASVDVDDTNPHVSCRSNVSDMPEFLCWRLAMYETTLLSSNFSSPIRSAPNPFQLPFTSALCVGE